MMQRRFLILVVLAMAGFAGAASGADVTTRIYTSDDTLLRLGPFSFAGGKTLNLSVGIGSAAFRHPNDPPNVVWTLGDRGPNLACSEMKELAGT
jgi:hypothetical protein